MTAIPHIVQFRLDQMCVVQKETVALAQGRRTDLGFETTQVRPTFAEQGIDKNLAHQARTLGALTDERFEELSRTLAMP